MLNRAEYTERPTEVYVETHPDGNDAWLRNDIIEVLGEENHHWEANEAYFKTNASEEDILEDFEGYFDEASGWEPEKETPVDIQQLRADVDYLLMIRGE